MRDVLAAHDSVDEAFFEIVVNDPELMRIAFSDVVRDLERPVVITETSPRGDGHDSKGHPADTPYRRVSVSRRESHPKERSPPRGATAQRRARTNVRARRFFRRSEGGTRTRDTTIMSRVL